MERTYAHLSLEDRCEISSRHQAGQSIRKIAASLDRAPSTIARELKRNAGRKVGYKPNYAHEQTKARRWTGSILARKPELQTAVLEQLARGLSPEQIAGRMRLENAQPRVSHETIYRFIYAQIARTQDFSWRLFLPRAKSKRGRRGKRSSSPASFIEGRIPVHQRDAAVLDREEPGHWEADLLRFTNYQHHVLTLHERSSRILLASRADCKAAGPIAAQLEHWLKLMPPHLCRTLTFDNGTEFACHLSLHPLGLQTYFCDPHAPWQKGGIENAHARLRRYLPRKTDLDTISPDHLNRLLRAYNSTPRKCLDFRTPAEVFIEQLLHFKCESTC